MSFSDSTFFILNDGTIKACGHNNYGQLGLGDTNDKTTPTLIPDLTDVKQIACGMYHTMFLLKDGTIKACGDNSSNQLGLGDNTNRDIPTLLSDLSDIKQLTTGFNNTIFLLNDDTVKACGHNKYGQLGLGDTTNRTSPTIVDDISDVELLAENIVIEYIIKNKFTILTNNEEYVYEDSLKVVFNNDTSKIKEKGYENIQNWFNDFNENSINNAMMRKYGFLEEK